MQTLSSDIRSVRCVLSSEARGNRVRWKGIRGMFLLDVVCCVVELIYENK